MIAKHATTSFDQDRRATVRSGRHARSRRSPTATAATPTPIQQVGAAGIAPRAANSFGRTADSPLERHGGAAPEHEVARRLGTQGPLSLQADGAWRRTRRHRVVESAEAKLIRVRLEELLSLALAYRGWTTRQLAATLDRCSGNVVPDSGLPKLDLLVHLAGVLDWPLETVIAHLSDELLDPQGPSETDHPRDTDELLRVGAAAVATGDAAQALRCARATHRAASHAGGRIRAATLEAEAWALVGRWDRAIAPLQRALHDLGPGDEVTNEGVTRLELLTSLARAYHRTGLWIEAGALASAAADSSRQGDARSLAARAEAISVRVLCLRDQLEATGSVPSGEIDAALRDAEECDAILGWPVVADRCPQAPCLRLMTAGAALELRTLRGEFSAPHAVAQVLEGLEPWIDVESVVDRAGLAGAGWWSVFGFALAARHLGGPTRHQSLAILSNKADEIAAAVHCWALRERVLRMEFERRQLAAKEGESTGEWLLDEEDVRVIVGCIGASRRFRTIGLDILRRATLVLSDST